jgi:hypothetical protein
MSEWQVAHETLSRLARERAAADAVEGHWLLRARRAQAHVQLGFGNFVSYVEQLFGYTPRSILEKLRVAEALEQLPALRAALEQGRVGWSAVRELTRVAVRETEDAWLQAARGKTVRQLEQLLAGKRPGDAPSTRPDPRAVRYVLRFEVRAEAYALFREALRELCRRNPSCFDDDTALLEMARCILGGPALSGFTTGGRDEGRSSYQIAISVCPECGSGRQSANGQLVAVPPEIVAMAECDAQRLPPLDGVASHDWGQAGGGHVGADEHCPAQQARPAADADVGSGVDELRRARDGYAAAAAHVGVNANELRPADDGRAAAAAAHVGGIANELLVPDTAHAASNLNLGSSAHELHPEHERRAPADAHVSNRADELRPADDGRAAAAAAHVSVAGRDRGPGPKGTRAKQDIPRALRRAVLRRDERRCRVAGCRNATFLDLHHILPRSEGGSHSADNLVTLCSAHHRALHRGELRGAGDASDFRVLPGELNVPMGAGALPASMGANSVDVSAKVASGLCQLGFRAADVRAVIAELRQQSELDVAPPQQWIREALRRLHPAPAPAR